MAELAKVVQMMVAPMVLISAAGLMLRQSHSRLGACIARTRAFDAKIQGLIERKVSSKLPFDIVELMYRDVRRMRTQGELVLGRAKILKQAIIQFEISMAFLVRMISFCQSRWLRWSLDCYACSLV